MKFSENNKANELPKIISWNICGICNYHCSYCSQGKHHLGSPTKRELKDIITALKTLGPGWEIKISGGEPFFCPHFFWAVKRLVRAGFLISVVTNFSYGIKVYQKFLRLTGPALKTFSLSLHREKVEWSFFLEKVTRIKEKLAGLPCASLVVNTVVIPGEVRELVPIKKEFRQAGIRLYPQLMRIKGRPVVYSQADEELINELTGDKKDILKANRGYSMKGVRCFAGRNYFIITQEGEAYTCYPGKRDGQGAMGSLVKGSFCLRDEPLLCPYDVCPCTLPINRGIVVSSKTSIQY